MATVYRFAISLVILFVIAQSTAFSQLNTTPNPSALDIRSMGDTADLHDMLKRPMIVMVLNEDENIIQKHYNKGEFDAIDTYKVAIKRYNDNFKAIVDSIWPFQNEFIYKTYSEIQALIKAKSTEYAVIYCVRYEAYNEGGETKLKASYDMLREDDISLDAEYEFPERSMKDYYSVLKIGKIEEFKRPSPFQVPLAHISPTKPDLYFAMYYGVWYINRKLEGAKKDAQLKDALNNNAKQLTDLVLLISGDDVKQKVLDDPYKSGYPYKFNIVPKEVLEQVIYSRSPGYAWMNVNCGKPCILNAATGDPLFMPRLYDWDAELTLSKMSKELLGPEEK